MMVRKGLLWSGIYGESHILAKRDSEEPLLTSSIKQNRYKAKILEKLIDTESFGLIWCHWNPAISSRKTLRKPAWCWILKRLEERYVCSWGRMTEANRLHHKMDSIGYTVRHRNRDQGLEGSKSLILHACVPDQWQHPETFQTGPMRLSIIMPQASRNRCILKYIHDIRHIWPIYGDLLHICTTVPTRPTGQMVPPSPLGKRGFSRGINNAPRCHIISILWIYIDN